MTPLDNWGFGFFFGLGFISAQFIVVLVCKMALWLVERKERG